MMIAVRCAMTARPTSTVRHLAGTTLLMATLFSSYSYAQVHVEIGDAGNLPATAQVIQDVPALTGVNGTLGTADQDMYKFRVTGGVFTATVSFLTPGADSQLFLFDSTGMGLFANDDAFALAGPSQITATLAAGDYYLAISEFNFDPISSGGLIFPDNFLGQIAATGPGAGSPVTDWTASSGDGFTYEITLTNAAGIPSNGIAVPDGSSSLGLLSFCMVTLMAVRRRLAS
jgi:hypothetical protein